MFDIMSAMNVHSFVDGQHRKSGPTLNAVTREKLGWLHPSRVWNRTLTYLAENVTLAAINRPDIDGYLFAKLLAPGRDGSPLSVYTIEFKEPAGWDRGFLHDHVVIHEIRTDGLVRLITNSNGGLLDLHPDREFVFPGGELVVRLLAIDGAAHRANIRVEARRIQYDWRWCRKCHGLFWAGGSTSAGRCPAGGAHDRGASSDYGLAMDLPEALGQRDWRWCEKCAGLFWAGSGQAAGTCPAGAAHRRGGSSDYTIVMGLPIPSGQSDWRWCFRCGGLFWAGGQLRAGACPAGSTHNQGSSSDYSVLFRS
jgi:hypothetical protein